MLEPDRQLARQGSVRAAVAAHLARHAAGAARTDVPCADADAPGVLASGRLDDRREGR